MAIEVFRRRVVNDIRAVVEGPLEVFGCVVLPGLAMPTSALRLAPYWSCRMRAPSHCASASLTTSKWNVRLAARLGVSPPSVTNMLGRLNEELRRRTRVVRIFPNAASCLRLTRALCVESFPASLTTMPPTGVATS